MIECSSMNLPAMDSALQPFPQDQAPKRGMQLLRFISAGAGNTLVSIIVYQLALIFVGHLPAYAVAYVVGVTLAYFLYARHVFSVRARVRSFVLFAIFYSAAGLIGGAINAGLIDALGWSARVAIFVTVLLMLPLNFLGSRWCLQCNSDKSGTRP